MITAQGNANEASSRVGNSRADMFETRDFYLACFCAAPVTSCAIFAPKAAGRFSFSRIAERGART